MGLPYGENFMILTSTVFYDTPVWQTDGQTDGRTGAAYSALDQDWSVSRVLTSWKAGTMCPADSSGRQSTAGSWTPSVSPRRRVSEARSLMRAWTQITRQHNETINLTQARDWRTNFLWQQRVLPRSLRWLVSVGMASPALVYLSQNCIVQRCCGFSRVIRAKQTGNWGLRNRRHSSRKRTKHSKKRKKSRLFRFWKKNVKKRRSNNTYAYMYSPEDHGDHRLSVL